MRYPYGKAILITGASSGIGRAAAELFADAGYMVWAGSRHCEESVEQRQNGGEIRSIQMDVCNEESSRQAVERAVAEGGLGIVLNCAGMGIAGPAEDTFEEAVRAQFEVNYFGTLRVNRLVLPYFRAQGKGLVLVMSSVAGRVPIPYQSHYSSSKYALDAYVEALRMETRPFGIRAALIEPGDTKTGFTAARRMAMPADSPYRQTCEGAIARMAHDEETGVPAMKPALAAFRLTEKENPPVRVTVGAMYKGVMALRKIIPARAFERILAAMYQ